jgi:hypothetical protein
MALSAPSIQQKRFAGSVAWERGLSINVWPETSSGVSGLIKALQAKPALPIVEWQVDAIRNALASCVASVDGFDPTPYSELPTDRAEANKLLNVLNKILNPPDLTHAAYRQALESADAYVTAYVEGEKPESERTDIAASVVTEEVPF